MVAWSGGPERVRDLLAPSLWLTAPQPDEQVTRQVVKQRDAVGAGEILVADDRGAALAVMLGQRDTGVKRGLAQAAQSRARRRYLAGVQRNRPRLDLRPVAWVAGQCQRQHR